MIVMPRSHRFSASLVVTALLAVACSGSNEAASPSAVASSAPLVPVSPRVSPTPTPPTLPKRGPKTHGAPSSTCVHGWRTPADDSPSFTEPLGIVRRTSGVQGPLEVVDMRYFTGPESPPSDQGYLLLVQRWYIRLYAKQDLSFQGRFLVESRRFGRGLSAVASYDTKGYESPDWRGFQWDAAHPQPHPVEGLPGEWSGVDYDFVKGGAGLSFPGLPDAVVGCLEGT